MVDNYERKNILKKKSIGCRMKIVAIVPMKLNNKRLPQKTRKLLPMENHCVIIYFQHF